MISNRNIAREHCGKCTKQIFIGQSAIVCQNCDVIFHSTCLTEFKIFREKLYCHVCIDNYDILRYNPFHCMNRTDDQYDKFYNNNVTDFTDTFENTCQVLENCRQYSATEVSTLIKGKSKSINNSGGDNHDSNVENFELFSHLFYNIDGNSTNFDEFLCNYVKTVDHKFSIIGLAETNTEKENKDVYKLEGYTSCYQSPKVGKQKGTGVCLYINEKYNFTELSGISSITDNLESLFVKLTNVDEPTIVGVVYRPPSGDFTLFQSEFCDILSNLPADHTVYILGDYNVDLLNEKDRNTIEFENIILTAGFIPLISTHTHKRGECRKSNIDNILTNNPEQVMCSGTIISDSHHKPIFQISYIKSKHVK